MGLGVALITRWFDLFLRYLGYAIILASVFLFVTPAHADQTLMVADNSTVNCKASAKDLTRIDPDDNSCTRIAIGRQIIGAKSNHLTLLHARHKPSSLDQA